MDFFFDYIVPWILLYYVLKLLLFPGAIISLILHPPRFDR